MAKSVVVVGMPRSGTSLVAGIFGRQGFFAAEDSEEELRDGDHHNPFGYWEAETLTRVNAEVFAAAGYPEDTSWLGRAMSDEEADRICRLAPLPGHADLVARYEARAPWIWKDPRLCYTLGYWWPMLSSDSTRVVITRRDPEAIYQSFVRVHWRAPSDEARDDVFKRVEGHLTAAWAAVERLGIPALEVQYEDFADKPAETARRLSEFLHLKLEPADLGFSSKLDHSSPRGRLGTFLERRYERLPRGVQRLAKRLAPHSLVRALFPERDVDRQ
jgi:hypothetical protein